MGSLGHTTCSSLRLYTACTRETLKGISSIGNVNLKLRVANEFSSLLGNPLWIGQLRYFMVGGMF